MPTGTIETGEAEAETQGLTLGRTQHWKAGLPWRSNRREREDVSVSHPKPRKAHTRKLKRGATEGLDAKNRFPNALPSGLVANDHRNH
jgi:hypothetical protein